MMGRKWNFLDEFVTFFIKFWEICEVADGRFWSKIAKECKKVSQECKSEIAETRMVDTFVTKVQIYTPFKKFIENICFYKKFLFSQIFLFLCHRRF